LGKLIEVALDENGTESAETYDLRSCLDRAGRCLSNAGDVLVYVGRFEAVGGNEAVDVKAAGARADYGSHVNMANCSGRDPGKDVLDLVVGNRRTVGTAQDRDYVGCRSPTFLMSDQSEIDIGSSPFAGYTGN
jgi:hypothetical protein